MKHTFSSHQHSQGEQDFLFPLVRILFFASPFFYGLFYEFCALAAGCLFALLGIACAWRTTCHLRLHPWSVGVFLLTMLYGSTCFHAVDGGMAFLGFLKKVSLLPFLWVLMQCEEKERERLLMQVPTMGAMMTALCIAAWFSDETRNYFFMAGRMSGTFQYANVFALFLLLGLVIELWKPETTRLEKGQMLLLLVGLLWSGSRSVFLLGLAASVWILLRRRKKKEILLLGAGIAFLGLMTCLVPGLRQTAGRIFTASLHSSTLWGRLLYTKDALTLLRKYPFGLGANGYSYVQGTVATGLYTTKYIHNDLLQLGLDVGWPVMLAAAAVFLWTWCVKLRHHERNRLLLLLTGLHALMDFDMEFAVMPMILTLAACPQPTGKTIELSGKSKLLPVAAGCILAVVSGYFFLPTRCCYQEDYEAALHYFPKYSEAEEMLLYETYDVQEAKKRAEHLLSENSYISVAYEMKALLASMEGDWEETIRYSQEAIALWPFHAEGYQTLAEYLLEAIESERAAEHDRNAAHYEQKLLELREQMRQQENKLSDWGKKLRDQPKLQFDKTVETFLDTMEETQ